MKNTFTYDEVKDILLSVYDFYDIRSTDKFVMNNLSNYSDEPPDDKVMEAEVTDVESFIF